jgi:hypothetical protein
MVLADFINTISHDRTSVKQRTFTHASEQVRLAQSKQ